MSDHKTLYAHIEMLQKVSGKNAKAQILDTIANMPMGAWLLDKIYNPFITYGISAPKTVDVINLPTIPLPFTDTYIGPMLEKLAKRELTGNAAHEEVDKAFEELDVEGRLLLWWILKKDLQAGVNITSVNAVVPGLLPVFSVARAHAYEEKRVKKWPVYGEPKLDGMRVTFLYKNGGGGFFSRTGNPLPALDHLVEDVMKTFENLRANYHMGGEAEELYKYITDMEGQPFFMLDAEVMTGLFASTGKVRGNDKAEGAELHLFDILSYDDFDAVGMSGPTNIERRRLLNQFFAWTPAEVSSLQLVPRKPLYDDAEVQAQFAEHLNTPLAKYLARGNKEREAELEKILIDEETGELKMLEGTIVKQPHGQYEKKKGYNWMKLKAEETEDLIVVGFFQGEPNTKNANRLGGLIVDRKGVRVRIGGGFKDKERDELWEDWQHDAALLKIDANCGFSGDWLDPVMMERAFAEHEFALLGRMIEVEYHEVTPDGSLRHPRFVRFRDDKNGEIEDKVTAAATVAKVKEALPAGYGRF